MAGQYRLNGARLGDDSSGAGDLAAYTPTLTLGADTATYVVLGGAGLLLVMALLAARGSAPPKKKKTSRIKRAGRAVSAAYSSDVNMSKVIPWALFIAVTAYVIGQAVQNAENS